MMITVDTLGRKNALLRCPTTRYLQNVDDRSISMVAHASVGRYRLPQVMSSIMTRCRSRGNTTFNKARVRPLKSWGFFMPSVSLYGGTCGAGLSVSLLNGSVPTTNSVRSATQTCRRVRGGSFPQQGTDRMSIHTLNPLKIRALAHRRMALNALRANSSLSVRLKRWNHHMDIVRSLEAQGGEA